MIKKILKVILQSVIPCRALVWKNSQKMGVALTFDDGPHPIFTPKILDVLNAFQVKATFFVVGDQVEKYPELICRIAKEGHLIGNHSETHQVLSGFSMKAIQGEIKTTSERIHALTGQSPTLFRPPKGVISPRLLFYLFMYRLTCVLWSVDPEDFEAKTAEEIIMRVSHQLHGNGDIILLHDRFAHTVEALPRILNGIKQRQLDCVTVGALI